MAGYALETSPQLSWRGSRVIPYQNLSCAILFLAYRTVRECSSVIVALTVSSILSILRIHDRIAIRILLFLLVKLLFQIFFEKYELNLSICNRTLLLRG